MADRCVECLDGLSGQCASALVIDRNGDYRRETAVSGDVFQCVECGLRIKRVETGLYQYQIDTAVYQAAKLFVVGIDHIRKTVWPFVLSVDVRSKAEGFGCGTHAARHKDTSFRYRIGRLSCNACSFKGHSVGQCLGSVFLLGYLVGTESIALDDVRPGLYVFEVNLPDYLRV